MAPPAVPEVLLKKRKQAEEARAHKDALADERKGGNRKKRRREDFKRAEVFVEEFRAKVRNGGPNGGGAVDGEGMGGEVDCGLYQWPFEWCTRFRFSLANGLNG